jgi:hypothetical protein
MVAIGDFADRAPRVLAGGEELAIGRHTMRWFDTPHVPHAWECGLMMDVTTRTYFYGDLFTQGGAGEVAVTESDILGPSEAFRAPMDYFAHASQTPAVLERLAGERPTTLACMHGSAWRGDGARLLRELSAAFDECVAASPRGSEKRFRRIVLWITLLTSQGFERVAGGEKSSACLTNFPEDPQALAPPTRGCSRRAAHACGCRSSRVRSTRPTTGSPTPSPRVS